MSRRKTTPAASAADRLVDNGVGLLVTPSGALAAAAVGEPDLGVDPWREQRLQAAADLARWEHRLERAAGRALSAWTAVVATAVLDDRYLTAVTAAAGDSGLPPDPGAIPALASTWRRLADTHIVRAVGDLLGEVFAHVLGDERTVSARPWQDAYLETVSNRLVSVADSTFDLVRAVVQDGIAEGASIPDLRDRVQESLDAGGETSWASRARTIARTECLPASTVVDGANVTAMYRRLHSGPWVTVRTQDGRDLAGTPNHPVLTTRGWVGLGQLAEGDHLICDRGDVEGAGASADEHVQGGPATLGELFDALSAVAVPVRVAGRQPDFHGDGADGEVEVQRPHGLLRLGRFTALDQRGPQIVLEAADLPAGGPAGLGRGFRRGLPVDEGASRFTVAEWDSLLAKPGHDRVPVAAEVLGDAARRPALTVERDDRGRVHVVPDARVLPAGGAGSEVLPAGADVAAVPADDVAHRAAVDVELGGQRLGALAGFVATDEVRSVDVGTFSGHVYNLTCVEGYFAAAGGLITSNTIGAYNGGTLAAHEVIQEVTDDVLHKVWLATIDVRTRDSHFRADGQRVPLGEPFTVGGHHLDHPGDPMGPPSECVNCRCSLLFVEEDEPTPDTSARGFRDAGEVAAEIARRASLDPAVVRAYDEAVTAAVLPARPAIGGQTVTAAGSGPGDAPLTEGRPRMPRTWASAPHLAPFGVPTGDGRIFKVGSLTARELPLPLLFQPASGMGHDGSVVVGRILAVEFTDAGVVASGDYLDADPTAAPDLSKAIEQAVALTESGLGHVSVDLSDVVGELVDEDGNAVSMEDLFDAWDRGEDPKVLEQVSEGKLIACTQVATPAFEGAKIELSAAAAPAGVDGEAALQDAAGAAIAVGAIVDAETDDGTVRGRVTVVDEDTKTVTVQPTNDAGEDEGDLLEVAPAAITVVTPAASEDGAAQETDKEVSLLAAAGPLRPPAEWFEDPKLTAPTALTITDDGRVYGHAALWGVCHVGFSNTCVTPPTSPSGYKHFHTGEVVTADGTRVAVGNLTLGGRHADVRLAYRSAIEHYDVQGAGAAVVRMYEDEHGIAFAGALTPGLTEEQLYDLRRSPVSGDWRRVGGELELIGVLSVNSPGFPTPRFATDEVGRTALTAAPSVRPVEAGRKRTALTQDELVARLTESVTARVRGEMAAEQRAERLRGLAAAVRPDPARQRRRLDTLAARVERPQRARLAELATVVLR